MAVNLRESGMLSDQGLQSYEAFLIGYFKDLRDEFQARLA